VSTSGDALPEKALCAIFRAAGRLKGAFNRLLEPAGLTEQQYNVLRILKEAGSCGLPTLAIAEKLIEDAPGITRLIDRLEAKSWVKRERPERDRRQVYCFITEEGLALLASLGPAVHNNEMDAFSGIPPAELKNLISTLDKVRKGNQS